MILDKNGISPKFEHIMKNLQEKNRYLKESKGLEVAMIALFGSQNYELDVYSEGYQSDIDAVAICVPTLESIIKGEPKLSTTIIMPDDSHIDVKDIRLMGELWKKCNPKYLEILFTPYRIINAKYSIDLIELWYMKEEIAEANKYGLMHAIKGMAGAKMKALTHLYPVQKMEIEIYGWAAKQEHHIHRLLYFAMDIENVGIENAWIPCEITKQELLDYKTRKINETKEEAIQGCQEAYEEICEIVDKYQDRTINEKVFDKLNNLIYNIIYNSIKEKIKEE